MATNQTGQFAEGVLGGYYSDARFSARVREIVYEPIVSSGIEIEYGRLYIPADKLAAFCTELIEMARRLGVTRAGADHY